MFQSEVVADSGVVKKVLPQWFLEHCVQFLHLQHLLLKYGPSRNRSGGGKNMANSPAIWRVLAKNQH